MHRKDFEVLAGSLSLLGFADDVVLALAKVIKSGKRSSEDLELLHKVTDYFDRMLGALKAPASVSRESVQQAAALEQAAGVLELVPASAEFEQRLRRLRNTAESIEGGPLPPTEELLELQSFFTTLGFDQVDRVNRPIPRTEFSGTGVWAASLH
jgi:hypothetical protein